MTVVQQSPESGADQAGMGRRWSARSLLVAGFTAVIVTASLGQTETAKKVCASTLTYCISAVSGGHWSYIDGSGGQVTNDPAATTDPCAGRNG